MGMSCPNSGFVGYPIALLVVGPVAGVMLGLNMIVENLLLIPLLLALAENSTGSGGRWHTVLRQSLLNLARNPMVLGLLAGFVVSALGWQMPSPVARTVTLFAQASAALSLFVIGGSLAGLHIAGLGRPVAQIAIGKLLLHPVAMLAVLLALEAAGMVPMDPRLRVGVVLTAASPMFGIFPILAQKHGHDGLAAPRCWARRRPRSSRSVRCCGCSSSFRAGAGRATLFRQLPVNPGCDGFARWPVAGPAFQPGPDAPACLRGCAESRPQ
jgi:malonate transporter